MIQKTTGFQVQNTIAAASEISDNLCLVSMPVEIVTHVFTFLTENSKNLLNLRLVCSRFKAIIETDGNCRRLFDMSSSRDPLFQNSSKISNYISKFLLHLTPYLISKAGVNKLLVSPSFKDRFAITILNIFLQKVLRNSISPADKQALIEKIEHLKTRLHITIEPNTISSSFELQENQNQENCNPLLELFINFGIDPTAVNSQTDDSLLGEAAALQNAEGIRIILEALKNKGIIGEELIKKLNTQNGYRETALHHATKNDVMPYHNRKKMKETVNLLLEHGADFHIENDDEVTPFDNFEISTDVKKFVKKSYIKLWTKKNSEKDSIQTKELYAAIKQKNPNKVKKLLETEENLINHPNLKRGGITPLIYALYYGNLEIVELILSYNPNLTHLDDTRYSVFHCCVSGKLNAKAKVNILKKLIQNAVSSGQAGMIAKADVWGNSTPFSIAINYNKDSLELVQLLLPYYRDEINQKPYLSMAVKMNQVEVARLLLEAGAKINFQPHYYDTDHPLYSAVSDENVVMTRSLLEFNADHPLYSSVSDENVEMTKLLLEFNTDPHEVNARHEDLDGNEMTILHIATKNLNLEIMKLLLSQEKIDLYVQDDECHTPLDIAMESGYYEGAKLLIHSGAQIKLTENSKILSEEGPHFDKLRNHLLYLFIKNKDLDSLQLLLNSPFDLQLTTINEEFGKSPIMYAKEIDPKIMQMIYRLNLNKSNRNGNYSN
ncbi:ankyrin repeat domain-containing protein [Candidatus Protochlamydia sp. W-9]|uniref:ankyrin repeat domain-containing protein n=1 Tax=Candidatus Protochlamydia sp. W-9 TaxID=1785087 RepID=UPI00096ACA1C|nr:ankyrin repeat domain-containing protein [Candidatus Protochlamydia sp. W-9]